MALNEFNPTGKIELNTVGGVLQVKCSHICHERSYKFIPDESLKGNPIRVTDAAQKYGIRHQTLSTWADKGFIKILKRAPRMLILDEATVARASAIFKQERKASNPYRAGWILKQTLVE